MEIQPCSQERPSSSRRMTREACADVVGSIACCPSGQMWTSSTRLQSYGGCPDTLRQLLPLVQMSGTRHFGLLTFQSAEALAFTECSMQVEVAKHHRPFASLLPAGNHAGACGKQPSSRGAQI
eukprot:TRINITY_DN7005_c0_g1_i15.p1 TRINITY_DN7005_c0_g1~~TRINITY_DN7005_c0_g1_i15.p1  ORF type:complete len:123 (+),score=6.70 TRINITY_DN7005_c0_g1_i15:65-433(+)